MKKKEQDVTEQYMKEAQSWETDKVLQLRKSNRTAWIVAVASGSIAFAAVMAVAALTPLKRVEPYVIRVDNSTGLVDIVTAMDETKTNYDEAVNKYFVQLYVRYREGYAKDLAEEYYVNTGLMSGSVESQKYYDSFNPKNPQSPINVYGVYAKVKIKIKSTSFINPDVALVRYTKEVERGADKPQITHWAATIKFTYNGKKMADKDRTTNPLGFQVLEYRNDYDASHDSAATQQSNQAPANYVQQPSQPPVTVFPDPAQSSLQQLSTQLQQMQQQAGQLQNQLQTPTATPSTIQQPNKQ